MEGEAVGVIVAILELGDIVQSVDMPVQTDLRNRLKIEHSVR